MFQKHPPQRLYNANHDPQLLCIQLFDRQQFPGHHAGEFST